MARQLARGMGSFFKDCGCAEPTRCPHHHLIRFRDALGEQREESVYGTQDDAIRAQPVPLPPDPCSPCVVTGSRIMCSTAS
ncbi:hypothetical protein ACIGW0_10055 [Streptomyces bikiniensis]|uniref:Uncharacterized protein n=1 Tax=Streptomyces bikiniensis TaxID=1896 RepID=A0ABW8CTN8_STRBI